MAYASLPAGASLEPTSFHVSVPKQELVDFVQLLRLSKVGPETYENLQEDRSFGLNRAWFAQAKKYWEIEYSW